MGRSGREALAPPQGPITLTNPAGVPPVGSSESTTFTVQGLPAVDNGWMEVSLGWPATADPEAQDWDFTLVRSRR